MRTSDVDRLGKPYDGDANAPTPGPAAALGVHTPTWENLETAILNDLSPGPPYGVAWWAPHPGTSRRILISDHLFACAQSVSSNIIESAIHRLELGDCSDRLSDRFANGVVMQSGKPIIKAPRPKSPLDDLGIYTMRLHYVGCAR